MTNSLRIIKRTICPKTPRANLGTLYGEPLSTLIHIKTEVNHYDQFNPYYQESRMP